MNEHFTIEQKILGFWQTNCWLIQLESEPICVLIDAGANPRKLWKEIQERNLHLKLILITHAHLDHIAGAHFLQKKSGATCYLHPKDIKKRWRWLGISFAKFTPVEHGDRIPFGNFQFQVFHTPGHSPGSVSYLLEDNFFCGDLLFANGVGRWDIPGGDFHTLTKSLKKTLGQFPDQTRILPGHGPATTLGVERKRNPLLCEIR
jgi:glyoxylase-like metal-dependent hydrolase (beta-lactamase superfamily II)